MAQDSPQVGAKRKLIVDCDDDTMRYLSELSSASERSNAWVVRRLIAIAAFRVFPGIEAGATEVPPDLVALKELGLLGLEAFSGDM